MSDLNEDYSSAKSRISSIKTFKEISAAAKQLKSSAGNSLSQDATQTTSALNKISEQQKRFLRNQPTSFDQLLELIGLNSGSGLETSKHLR